MFTCRTFYVYFKLQKEVANQLAESLQKDKSFLSSDLFRGIGHRSSTLSNHFLFIATQLLHCYDVSMQVFIIVINN